MTEAHIHRKLAAILAADVVGYSRLMGADEAGTLTALKRHRETVFDPAVAAHNGRIVKLIGDGTIVEFGSVVDAVNCALSVQRSGASPRDHSASQPDHCAPNRHQPRRCHHRRRRYLRRWRQHRGALGAARRARRDLHLLDRQREHWQSDRRSFPGRRRHQCQEYRPADPNLEVATRRDEYLRLPTQCG